MPNWCYTEYEFYGTENEIDKLEDFLDRSFAAWEKSSRKQPGMFDCWLGALVMQVCSDRGITDHEEIDKAIERLSVRGEVSYIERPSDCVLEIGTETAWSPMHGVWDYVLEHLGIEDVSMSYYAEEPGVGIFEVSGKDGTCFEGFDYAVMSYIDSDEYKAWDIEDKGHIFSAKKLEDSLRGIFDTSASLESMLSMVEDFEFDDGSYFDVFKIEEA